jgi:NitT/TauT family transport system substrate-binding protein
MILRSAATVRRSRVWGFARRSTFALALLALLPFRTESQTLTKIVVAMTPTDDAAALLYGVQSGVFRRAGLDVDVQKAPSGAAMTAALVGGTFQFGSSSTLSVATAIAKGVPLVFVAPGGLYDSTTEFVATVVKANSTLRPGPDLNGHTIGSVSLQDLNSISMLTWIQQHGGDPKTVKVIEIPYSAQLPAMDEGRIDMATLIQPNLSLALRSGKVRVVGKAYDAIAPRFYITTWIARKDWAAANPDTVRRFATAIRESEIYANSHKAETAALVAPFAGIDLDSMLKGGRDTFATTYLDPKDIQPVIDAAWKYKMFDQRFDAADVIDPAVKTLRS